jgi:phospholipase C
MTTPLQNIKHVFVLMLENRSLDHMLGFSGITGKDAVDGTTTKINGLTGNETNSGLKVTQPADWSMPADPCHEFPCVVEQLCGAGANYPHGGPYPPINNSGFVSNYANNGGASNPGEIMKGYSPGQLPVLNALASEFAVCDNWYSSMPGPTWPNRFFVHAASSAGLDHSPTNGEIAKWFIFGLGFPNGTIFDRLSKASKKWHIYRGDEFPISLAFKGVHFLANTSPLRHFKDQVQSTKHPFPYDYTFIEPSYGNIFGNYQGGTSQHPLDNVVCGEWLIKNVYEWIRNSPLWNDSLLIVTWDEHGGFYDHMPPGGAASPGDNSMTSPLNQNGFTFTQYGVRVPAVVVSSLIPQNLIDHRIYDHSSVPATLESLWGLNPLTQRDSQANEVGKLVTLPNPRATPATLPSPADLGSQCPFPAPPGPEAAPFAEKVVRPAEPPDEGNVPGFLFLARKVDSELSAVGQSLLPVEHKMSQPALEAAVDTRYKSSHTSRRSAALYLEQIRKKARAAEHMME